MSRFVFVLATLFMVAATPSGAQHFPINDDVIKGMYTEGIERSQTRTLAHHLIDRIGPRLAGSTNLEDAADWLAGTYESWGIDARKEQFGTWARWNPGILHVDMLEPRVATLEAKLKAWSPGTDGPVEAEVVFPPDDLTPENAGAWLNSVRGKFVMLSPPEEMCRAKQEVAANASPMTAEALGARRTAVQRAWAARLQTFTPPDSSPWRVSVRSLVEKAAVLVDNAGAAGIIESNWSEGWGVNKIFETESKNAVAIDLSCEDYGLLYRLSTGGTTPRLRINAEAELLGEVPQFNVLAEIRGTELPNEYVILGAHMDSWGGATGATDNGTGTITMLEAMRLLKTYYPNPRRTIIVAHWGIEERGGLMGSGTFREDHPEMLDNIQVVFNQDNGTWKFEKIEGQGFADAAAHVPYWVSALPTELKEGIELEMPGAQNNSGSDHSSFVCADVPAFRLQSPYDEYRQYTWHTNRDTYDKIVFDELAQNATIAAMLAYMASEDPDRVGRDRTTLPNDTRTGRERSWRECRTPSRNSGMFD